MDAKVFGQFLAEVRKANNITQVELAKKLNVTDKAVSRWERGLGFPDINTLEPLADALGVSVLELMQSKRTDDAKLISAEKAEEMLIETIQLSKAHNKPTKIAGGVILVVFAAFAIGLLGIMISDWSVLNLIVPSIVLGVITWAIPVWKMTLSRKTDMIVPTIASFGSALLAVLFRIINIAHDINTNDVVAVIDTIDSEVVIVSIFIAITLMLNLCSAFIVKRR